MATVYLDSSAIYKLIVREPESEALRQFLFDRRERATSQLTQVEIARAVLREEPADEAIRERSHLVLQEITLLAMSAALLEHAARVPPPKLRSLDAIHLATALSIPELAGMVVYDRRLAAAAAQHGLRVWSPGRPA